MINVNQELILKHAEYFIVDLYLIHTLNAGTSLKF